MDLEKSLDKALIVLRERDCRVLRVDWEDENRRIWVKGHDRGPVLSFTIASPLSCRFDGDFDDDGEFVVSTSTLRAIDAAQIAAGRATVSQRAVSEIEYVRCPLDGPEGDIIGLCRADGIALKRVDIDDSIYYILAAHIVNNAANAWCNTRYIGTAEIVRLCDIIDFCIKKHQK